MSDIGWPNPPQAASNGNVKQPESRAVALVAETPPPPAASPRLRLSSIADCKREIRRTYIAARNGEISGADASRFVWMINTLANLIADAELEERVARLESGRG